MVECMERRDLSREDDQLLRESGRRWPDVKVLVEAGMTVFEALAALTRIDDFSPRRDDRDDVCLVLRDLVVAGFDPEWVLDLPIVSWSPVNQAYRWSQESGSWTAPDIQRVADRYVQSGYLLSRMPSVVAARESVEQVIELMDALGADLLAVQDYLDAGFDNDDIAWVVSMTSAARARHRTATLGMTVLREIAALPDTDQRRLAALLLALDFNSADLAIALASLVTSGHQEVSRLLSDGWSPSDAVRSGPLLATDAPRRVTVALPSDTGVTIRSH